MHVVRQHTASVPTKRLQMVYLAASGRAGEIRLWVLCGARYVGRTRFLFAGFVLGATHRSAVIAMPSPLDLVIGRLERINLTAKQTGTCQWEAQCPAHDDRNASLSVGVGDDERVLLHCHTGCSSADVWAALDIEPRELFVENGTGSTNGHAAHAAVPAKTALAFGEQHVKHWQAELRRRPDVVERLRSLLAWSPDAIECLEVGYDGSARVVFPVRDAAGVLVGVVRHFPKSDKRGPDVKKSVAAPGSRRDLYPAPESVGETDVLWLVEGEPAAVSARSVGLTAVAFPGTGKRDSSWPARFAGRRVVVCCDCDDAGREAGAWWVEALRAHASDLSLLDLDVNRGDGFDVGDMIAEYIGGGLTAEKLRGMLEGMAENAKRIAGPPETAPLAVERDNDDDEWPVLADRPPFPVSALPASVQEWVAAVAEESQTPPDLPALAALGVLSAAGMGPAIDYSDWTEESIALYVLVAMPSGDRKSAVLRIAKEPLTQLQSELRKAAEPAFLEQKTRRDVLDVRIKKLTKTAGESSTPEVAEDAQRELVDARREYDEIGEPVRKRLYADDATPEALSGLLAQHGKMAVLAAESAFIDNLLGRYGEGGSPNLHLVCGAYTGDQTMIDRRGRDTENIDRPLLTICLTVQPHVLEALVAHKTARSQGLVARFAYVVPETNLGRRTVDAPRIPVRAREGWAATVRRVADAVFADNAATNHEIGISVDIVGTFGGLEMRLSSGAAELLRTLRREIEPRLAEVGGDLNVIADWVSRHPGRIARIAALLHLTEHSASRPINETTMRDALRIGEYLLAHARAALTGPGSESRRALNWLAGRGEPTVTVRDLHRGLFRGHGPTENAAAVAVALVNLGALRPAAGSDEPRGRGRPPSPVYEVHPDLVSGVSR
jgi:replicative DNA helicase